MMVASHDWLVQPWYSQIEINGQDPPSDQTLRPEPGTYSACRGSKLALYTSGSDLKVRLRAETWTEAPLADDPRLDQEAAIWTLHVPAGQITVSDSDATAAEAFSLPAPGRYQVWVKAYHTDTRQLYDEAVKRSSDWDDPAFQGEIAQLTGRELWLVRLWPATRPVPRS